MLNCFTAAFAVFNGGHLEYIDYDTKDKTFDKMVAAAYQVRMDVYSEGCYAM